jgi:phage baseplate assembly protein gpV
MTKDYVTLGAEDNSKTHKDTFKQEEHIMAPDKAYIRFDNDGNITIEAVKDLNITIKGGNTTLKSSSTVKVESPDVTITGGKLTVNGSVAPTTGPFNCLTNCLYSGAPHSGNIVTGT